MRKSILPLFLFAIYMTFFSVSLVPQTAEANFLSPPSFQGLIPCGKSSGTAEEMTPCRSCHIIPLLQRLSAMAVYIASFLLVLGIAWTGLVLAISAFASNTEMRGKAKGSFKTFVVGFLIAVGSYTIINLSFWLVGQEKSPLENKWGDFSCNVPA